MCLGMRKTFQRSGKLAYNINFDPELGSGCQKFDYVRLLNLMTMIDSLL